MRAVPGRYPAALSNLGKALGSINAPSCSSLSLSRECKHDWTKNIALSRATLFCRSGERKLRQLSPVLPPFASHKDGEQWLKQHFMPASAQTIARMPRCSCANCASTLHVEDGLSRPNTLTREFPARKSDAHN